MANSKIKIGVIASWKDPDNDVLLSGTINRRITSDYWETRLLNSARKGKVRHVRGDRILSIKEPIGVKETQLEIFV